MHISICSLQTHNVNKRGRIYYLERKLSLHMNRSNPDTTEIYTLSLHDALPILSKNFFGSGGLAFACDRSHSQQAEVRARSEEHTSELQSQSNIVCCLLLEKKNLQMKK